MSIYLSQQRLCESPTRGPAIFHRYNSRMSADVTILRPADRLASLPAYFYADLNRRLSQLADRGMDIIRLDMGSPDLPPAGFIVDAMERSAREPSHHGYMPYAGTPAYRKAWADFYGRRFGVELDPGREVLGLIGSKEGIFHLAQVWVNPGDIVLMTDPGYITYTSGVQFAGGRPVYLPITAESSFLPDLRNIPADTLRQTRLLWLNYPNNPTGAVAPLAFFAEAVALAREHGFLIAHDAPYTEVSFDDYRAPSVLQVPGARDVAVEFHSLSKTYNMAGWRAGVVAGNETVVEALAALKAQVDTSTWRPILDAGVAALTGDQTWLVERNHVYRRRRDATVAAVRTIGLRCETPAAALYVWARLPADTDDLQFATDLLDATGVSVTPGRVFGPSGSGYIRLSLCTPEARLREALERMKEWGLE